MIPWTVTHQAPLCMGFPRQEYWSGLPFPSPGDLPDPGIESRSPALLEDSLLSESLGKPGVLVPEFMKFPLKKVQIMSFHPLINKLSLGRGSEFLESNQAKGSGLYVTFYIIFFLSSVVAGQISHCHYCVLLFNLSSTWDAWMVPVKVL